jgi:hypothetical protein
MNPAELKAVVEYMESERGVEREIIIKAIEAALQSATENARSTKSPPGNSSTPESPSMQACACAPITSVSSV